MYICTAHTCDSICTGSDSDHVVGYTKYNFLHYFLTVENLLILGV